MLPADRCHAVPEIAVYLKESVGNATRIDYGTGTVPFRFGGGQKYSQYSFLCRDRPIWCIIRIPKRVAVLKITAKILLKWTRIISGHEAAFAAFLCCLCKIGVLGTEDQLAMVFKVFTRWASMFQPPQTMFFLTNLVKQTESIFSAFALLAVICQWCETCRRPIEWSQLGAKVYGDWMISSSCPSSGEVPSL